MPPNSEPQTGDELSLRDALEREAATREILQVISQSRDDVQPVLDTIVRNAARLCKARDVGLHVVNEAGTHTRLAAALSSNPEAFRLGDEFELASALQTATAVREARIIHIPDIADDPLYHARDPVRVKLVEEGGIRSRLSVPLLKNGAAFGCINLNRAELRPFADDEIALIETFAQQAVIAIENVRQFRELQTRLEREAATREILQVISQSREDEQPVFDTILENAVRLCNAASARLHMMNDAGTEHWMVAARGEALHVFGRGEKHSMDSPLALATAMREARTIAIADIPEDDLYRQRDPIRVKLVEDDGVLSFLAVPLVKSGKAIGAFGLHRREVRPFAPDEVTLVETFAAQAVIAIENVRQFRELQTRLEREAATREILQVISQSRADEQPVFEAILENASRLCNAPLAFLSMANEARTRVRIPAHRGVRPEFAAVLDAFNEPVEDSVLLAVRPVSEGKIIRVDDIANDELYRKRHPRRVQLVEVEGVRSILVVPLMSGGKAIGGIVLYRREVSPFSDDDVALVQSFAA